MRNQDRRFDRFFNDSRFHALVKFMENLFYSDNRFTYEEVLDAAFVARCRFIEMNPSATMIALDREGKIRET